MTERFLTKTRYRWQNFELSVLYRICKLQVPDFDSRVLYVLALDIVWSGELPAAETGLRGKNNAG